MIDATYLANTMITQNAKNVRVVAVGDKYTTQYEKMVGGSLASTNPDYYTKEEADTISSKYNDLNPQKVALIAGMATSGQPPIILGQNISTSYTGVPPAASLIADSYIMNAQQSVQDEISRQNTLTDNLVKGNMQSDTTQSTSKNYMWVIVVAAVIAVWYFFIKKRRK